MNTEENNKQPEGNPTEYFILYGVRPDGSRYLVEQTRYSTDELQEMMNQVGLHEPDHTFVAGKVPDHIVDLYYMASQIASARDAKIQALQEEYEQKILASWDYFMEQYKDTIRRADDEMNKFASDFAKAQKG